jgi:hypothetical protein
MISPKIPSVVFWISFLTPIEKRKEKNSEKLKSLRSKRPNFCKIWKQKISLLKKPKIKKLKSSMISRPATWKMLKNPKRTKLLKK